MNNKLPQAIFDSVSDNIKKLESLFPAAVKDGQLDIEALKEELGQFEEVGKERYELTWAGKQRAKKLTQEDVLGRTLKFVPCDSKYADTTENLYIEGDNLEVLKLLRQNYYGAIKMIYIDPPYNTGNDFVYRDDFAMSAAESDEAEGETDEGERMIVNQKTSNRYHANWLNMMYPRLKVAKDLLREDGVIFISIDDNEVKNLRNCCDEIFGELNFVADIIWQKKTGASDAINIAVITEHVLVFSRLSEKLILNQNTEAHDEKRFRFKDEYFDERGPFYYDNLDRGTLGYHESLDYPVLAPNGDLAFPNGRKMSFNDGWRWKWGKEKLEWGIKNGFIEVQKATSKESGWGVYYKIYLNVDNDGNKIIRSSPYKNLVQGILNTHASAESKEIFNTAGLFSNPKPVALVKLFLEQGMVKDDNDIIIDFFSGSATTAHAVMQLNAEDGGNRKFIMVQYPETCDEKSEAYKAGYKTICDIGKERIRRAGEKVKAEVEQANQQIKLGEEPKNVPDIGFKVFRTADTNIRWTNMAVKMGQLEIDESMLTEKDKLDFMPHYTDLDVMYEIMLRQRDIPLSVNVEKLPQIGERTYIFADSYIVSLEEKITLDMVEQLAKIEPTPIKYIFRDSAFEDDITLKDETMRRLSAYIARNTGDESKTYTVEFI